MQFINALLESVRNVVRGCIQPIAQLLNKLTGGKLNPNAITVFGFAMHLPIAVLIARGYFIYGAIALAFFGLFDTLDGALARLQGSSSKMGMLLDSVTDKMKEVLLYIGVGYFFVWSGQPYMAVWAIAACGAGLLVSYINAWGDVVTRDIKANSQTNKAFRGGLMSSRKGNILRAVDIIEAATKANQTVNNQDNPDTVLAAIKYAFLKNRIGGDIVYDPAEAVALEGNSGPYLQYAHARACSILAKAKAAPSKVTTLEKAERSLLRKISQYPEVIELATQELSPHYICTYLYELAQTFNRFYENNRVIGDKRQDFRLSLVQAYAGTLKNGLELLNIPAPEQM